MTPKQQERIKTKSRKLKRHLLLTKNIGAENITMDKD
jgi:hypothetical protein